MAKPSQESNRFKMALFFAYMVLLSLFKRKDAQNMLRASMFGAYVRRTEKASCSHIRGMVELDDGSTVDGHDHFYKSTYSYQYTEETGTPVE